MYRISAHPSSVVACSLVFSPDATPQGNSVPCNSTSLLFHCGNCFRPEYRSPPYSSNLSFSHGPDRLCRLGSHPIQPPLDLSRGCAAFVSRRLFGSRISSLLHSVLE